MTTKEVAEKLAGYCRQGQTMEAIAELYADDIVSLEPQDNGPFAARTEGRDAVRKKNEIWADTNDLHESSVRGPWVNHDRFVVRYEYDFTPRGGERTRMEEVAVYTVSGGKIVKEEFFY